MSLTNQSISKVYPSLKVYLQDTMVVFLDENDDIITCVPPGEVNLKQLGNEGFTFLTDIEPFAVSFYDDVLDSAGNPHGATFIDTLNALCTFLNFERSLGEVNTASNVGAGDGVFKQKTGVDLEFKSLSAGTNITLTSSADEIQIDAAGGGESNTASNVGTGAGVFKQKTGVDLEMRSISSSDFDVTEGADEIEIQADPALISNQSTVTAVAGMNALVEDSGNLRKVDVNDFLGGGGGHEPYIGNTLISTLDLSGQSSVNNINVNSYNGFAVGVPFMMQEDVDLNSFIVVQNNATSVGLTAKFGIFKYTGNSGAFTTPYVFTKEYQHPTDINAGITGSQSFTLATPYTFTAGDVYMCIIVHDTPALASGSPDKPAYAGRRTLGQSNIIGINPSNLSQYGRVLQTNSNATISGGNIASTINFDVIGQGNFAATPLIYLDIENA